MPSTIIAEDVERLFQEHKLTQDEYITKIVEGISECHGLPDFLKCVYEMLYDEEHHQNLVGTLSNEHLVETLIQLRTSCEDRHDEETPTYLNLLLKLMEKEEYGVVGRWGLSRLVGMSVNAHLR